MKKYISQITVLGLLAAAMMILPATAHAQDAKANVPPNQTMTPKAHKIIPFRGKVTAVDTNAMTLAVGKRVFQVTSDTKISRDGQPAALSEGVVGEPVRGTYQKTEAGKLEAFSVYFGAKQKRPDLSED